MLLSIFMATLVAGPDVQLTVGDIINGGKLFEQHCKSRYQTTGIDLFKSAEMTLITDQELTTKLRAGDCITSEQKAKFDGEALSYLDRWDVVAFIRTLHLNIDDFFPSASRYIAKTYTIDEHGLKRIADASKPLSPKQRAAPVFTFFDFEDEAGNLTYVPQEPIKLDALKKDKKSGYLVFLPMKHEAFSGEVGLGMDAQGVLTKVMVHPDAPGAQLLNQSLSRFVGMGRLGQKEPFQVSGGRQMDQLAKTFFPIYLRAMETVTMYNRDEAERTWAD